MQSNSRGSVEARVWASELAGRIGEEIHRLRTEVRKMSAVQLAERTAELGYPITRGTIAKIESNSRAAKLDIAELMVLARALGIPPLQLLVTQARLPNGRIEAFPGVDARAVDVAFWFTGEEFDYFEEPVGLCSQDKAARIEASPIRAVRQYVNTRERYSLLLSDATSTDASDEWKESARTEAAEARRRLSEMEAMMRDHGMAIDDD